MNEQSTPQTDASTAAPVSSALESSLGWGVMFGVAAVLVYQLAIRPDQGERTVRLLLANQ